MMHALLAPFAYAFMQRALVAALIVGILCSMMGTYVVLRKLAFIGDGLAHASFAGIVIAYLRNIDYQLGAAVVARGTPVLMTTHDLERVDEWFDRLMVLDRRTLALGTPEEVAASGAYSAIREHTHTHGHLRVDHDPHEGHEAHPEVRV